MNTHVHADHITGTGKLKAALPDCKSAIGAAGKAKADVQLKDGDVIKFGKFQIEARCTPGHTNGKLCLACSLVAWNQSQSVAYSDYCYSTIIVFVAIGDGKCLRKLQ